MTGQAANSNFKPMPVMTGTDLLGSVALRLFDLALIAVFTGAGSEGVLNVAWAVTVMYALIRALFGFRDAIEISNALQHGRRSHVYNRIITRRPLPSLFVVFVSLSATIALALASAFAGSFGLMVVLFGVSILDAAISGLRREYHTMTSV